MDKSDTIKPKRGKNLKVSFSARLIIPRTSPANAKRQATKPTAPSLPPVFPPAFNTRYKVTEKEINEISPHTVDIIPLSDLELLVNKYLLLNIMLF